MACRSFPTGNLASGQIPRCFLPKRGKSARTNLAQKLSLKAWKEASKIAAKKELDFSVPAGLLHPLDEPVPTPFKPLYSWTTNE
ncbi:hypothetical protein MPNT_220031 [Candidatus Methylacidithermus pantelleriae]|uniref:Uncharacterized protein n=1 Tax=Candidatus Methylacidithermus pantelleriae TaxID=2744239 RepID=A0A8J2BIF8_9BACT|nr:hypothetical protein MPNT_220031 [Candidatus Methylacidithermus pantelleriae]